MEYKDLTHKIIGCAMEVHKHLGNGFQEVVYQRALSIELNMNNIAHEREKEMQLNYKGFEIGTRRVDFFVNDTIMVEIKAVINLEDVHLAQAMNYIEAYNLEVGLLLNFGAKSLQFKRVHNNKILKKSNTSPNLDYKDEKGYQDFSIKKSSNQDNPKNHGSDNLANLENELSL